MTKTRPRGFQKKKKGKTLIIILILLVLAILVHVISNAKPMLISFGIRSLRERVFDILFVISVLLLFMAFAFVIYYLRWRA